MYIKYIRTIGYLEGRVKAYEHMVEESAVAEFRKYWKEYERNYE